MVQSAQALTTLVFHVLAWQLVCGENWRLEFGSDVIPRPGTDQTENCVYLVPHFFPLPRYIHGITNIKAISWNMYSNEAGLDIYLQVWIYKGTNNAPERYRLIAQTQLVSVMGNASTTGSLNIDHNAEIDADIDKLVLGVYFTGRNPIAHSTRECRSTSEQMRYLYDPQGLNLGRQYQFEVVPLSAEPCREYSIQSFLSLQSTQIPSTTPRPDGNRPTAGTFTGSTPTTTITTTTTNIFPTMISPTPTPTPRPSYMKTTIFIDEKKGSALGCDPWLSSPDMPCNSIRYTLLMPDQFDITLVIVGQIGSTAIVNLSDVGPVTNGLTVAGPRTFDLSAEFVPTIRFEQSDDEVVVDRISLSDLNLEGDLNIENDRGYLMLNLSSVTVRTNEISSGLINIKYPNLDVYVADTSLLDYTLNIESRLLRLHINNSILKTTNYTNSSSGVFINLPSHNNNGNIDISNTSFLGLGQDRHKELPSGAISVIVRKDSSSLSAKISDSTFEGNSRALDFSLKGSTNISLSGNTFASNRGVGSGGAVRITSTLGRGLGGFTVLKGIQVKINGCNFSHNWAEDSGLYGEEDLYFQTRSVGGGGAIFVYATAKSPLVSDGLVSIRNTTFVNNTASVQGGTLFVSPGITTHILDSHFSNTETKLRPQLGEVVHGLSSFVVKDTTVDVMTSDGSVPIISYQAADPTNLRLKIERFHMSCPSGFWADYINSTSRSAAGGIETLQLYCRACPDGKYSLEQSSVSIQSEKNITVNHQLNCLSCPYGAICRQGVRNADGFWGTVTRTENESNIVMYRCPEEYCKTEESVGFMAYDRCAGNRTGRLCGRCREGYSESLFGPVCVPNSHCGGKNWYVVLLVAVYGILYLICFMFEREWGHFVNIVFTKINNRGRRLSKRRQDAPSQFNVKQKRTEAEDHSGYFQSFMYFIQTAALLRVETVVMKDEAYGFLYRPQDLIPTWLIAGLKKMFSFDVLALHSSVCSLADVTPVVKGSLKFLFVAYLYMVLLFLFLITGGCFLFMEPDKRPRIRGLKMSSRMLCTVVSLFLYTYQLVAEQAFFLLNCTSVEGEMVLFHDGTVSCLQSWQYTVIAFVVVFVVPFFLVLFFGPSLLKSGDVSLLLFFMSLTFPLFFCVPIMLKFFGIIKTTRSHRATGEGTENDIALLITGPYRDLTKNNDAGFANKIKTHRKTVNIKICNIFDVGDNLVCWEGVIIFRRMIVIMLYTFVNDFVLKQILLVFACFFILLCHFHFRPFKLALPNTMESISLSLLLVISWTNLVKASFFNSQTVPRGGNYLVVVITEWVDTICIGILPLCLMVFLLSALIIGILISVATWICCENYKKPDGNAVQCTNIALRSCCKKANPTSASGTSHDIQGPHSQAESSA